MLKLKVAQGQLAGDVYHWNAKYNYGNLWKAPPRSDGLTRVLAQRLVKCRYGLLITWDQLPEYHITRQRPAITHFYRQTTFPRRLPSVSGETRRRSELSSSSSSSLSRFHREPNSSGWVLRLRGRYTDSCISHVLTHVAVVAVWVPRLTWARSEEHFHPLGETHLSDTSFTVGLMLLHLRRLGGKTHTQKFNDAGSGV